MQVTLDSGHNLAIRDSSGLCEMSVSHVYITSLPFSPSPPLSTGSSDPYVKFKHEHFKYRSAFINQNLNPQWNEIFSFKTTDLIKPLQIKVFDHDYGSKDDFMGAASVNLAEHMDGQYVFTVCVSVCMCVYVHLVFVWTYVNRSYVGFEVS